jgi:ABC-type branched-subunit amino acid transport system substrate-binding protein
MRYRGRATARYRRHGRRLMPLIALATTPLMIVACGSAGSSGTSASGGSGSSASHTITLGWEGSLTGPFGAISQGQLHGLVVASNAINNSGGVVVNGVHYKFTWAYCNDNSDLTMVAACTQQLVHTDNVRFMFGGGGSHAPIVLKITQPAKVIFFTGSSAISASVGINKSPYLIDTSSSGLARATAGVLGLLHLYPTLKTVVWMGDQDSTSQAAEAALAPVLAQYHIKLADVQYAPSAATSFTSQMTVLKSYHPQVLLTEMSTPDRQNEVVTENYQLGIAPAVFDNSTSCSGQYANSPGIPFIANTTSGAITIGDHQTPGIENYITQYFALKGAVGGNVQDPSPYDLPPAQAQYDAVGMLAKAMENAGTVTDAKAIIAAINTLDYVGLNGPETIRNNQASYGLVICSAPSGNGNGAGPDKEFEVYPNGTFSAYSETGS